MLTNLNRLIVRESTHCPDCLAPCKPNYINNLLYKKYFTAANFKILINYVINRILFKLKMNQFIELIKNTNIPQLHKDLIVGTILGDAHFIPSNKGNTATLSFEQGLRNN